VTDDIVDRLRFPLPWQLKGMTTKQLGDERREAADEIERLRNEVKYLNQVADQLEAQVAFWITEAHKKKKWWWQRYD
jgi:hypothetical protein